MTTKLLMMLAMLTVAAPVYSATLLTMTGEVTEENYGGDPSPYAEAATNVTISVIFDDTIPPSLETNIGTVEVAVYTDAILQTTLDVLGADQTVLASIEISDPLMSLMYSPILGSSRLLLQDNFAASPGQPFVEFDLNFFGDNMFNSTDLSEITAGRLEFANSAWGELETTFGTLGLDGIRFEFGGGSVDVQTISPVPAPPAILAMFTGLFGLNILSRLRQGRSRNGRFATSGAQIRVSISARNIV